MLAELKFVDRAEVLHLVGPPGTGKSHLSLALGVEAVKASVLIYEIKTSCGPCRWSDRLLNRFS